MPLPILKDETSGRNRLILRQLQTPRKLWRKGDLKHYELEYQWLSETGGVQGNEYTYWSAKDAEPLLSASSLFDAVTLF